jgi:hypothetical protein
MSTPFEWAPTFLETLAKSPNVSAAARAAGVSRESAYKHRKADPDFALAWDDALAESTDELVGECYRRAREGVEEPVFHNGEECGSKLRFSDTLAIFLLKAHRPDVYVDRIKQDVHTTGDPGEVVRIFLPHNGRDADGRIDP